MKLTLGLSALLVVATASPAAAHDPRPFVMGDLSDDGVGGLETMIGKMDFGADVTLLTMDIAGEFFVSPSFKVLLRVPVAYVSWEDSGLIGEGDSGVGIGNLLLGGRWLSRSGPAGHDTVLGIGASVSGFTASDAPGDDATAAMTLAGIFNVLRDLGPYAPNVTTLRLQFDLRLNLGRGFVQGQLGFHHYMSDEDGDDDLTLLRIVAGAGFHIGTATALVGELISTSFVLEDSDQDEFLHAVQLGVRWGNPGLQFGASVYVPIDEGDADTDTFGLGIDLLSQF